MAGFLKDHRWSTLTLLGVGVVVGGLGDLIGRVTRARDPVEINRHVAAPPTLVFSSSLRVATARSAPTDEKSRALEFEHLGASDPARALALAAVEPNWRLRVLLRNAAVRGWASVAPIDAARFVLTLPDRERREAAAALFQGAAPHPEAAASVATLLCAQDPALAEDYGRSLIEALAEVGAFSDLIRFAASDTAGHGGDWFSATFYHWAERQPVAARDALETWPASPAREAAFQGLVLGWSMADPRELAGYAVSLPAGENRSLALRQALSQWVLADVDAVAAWVLHFDPGPDFDLSAATVATQPKFAAQQPAVALGWAQSIVEPALRESTLTALARQWAQSMPDRAHQVIAQTPGLLPADRELLLVTLNSPATPEP